MDLTNIYVLCCVNIYPDYSNNVALVVCLYTIAIIYVHGYQSLNNDHNNIYYYI